MSRFIKVLCAVLTFTVLGAACAPAPTKWVDNGLKLVSPVQGERICAAKTGGVMEVYPDYIQIPAKPVTLTSTNVTLWLYGKSKAIVYSRFPDTATEGSYWKTDIASDVKYHNAHLIEGSHIAQFIQCGAGPKGGRDYAPVVLGVHGD